MPTGYTAPVKDGEITDFPTFAMQCARAFGALVEMRDASMDAPIPDEFTPSTRYHDEAIERARTELDRLSAMTEADKVQAEAEAWEQHVAGRNKINDRAAEERKRYEAMLENVRAWEPPTSNHVELKTFMIDQLEQSIDFDCKPWPVGVRPSPAAWWIEQVEENQRSITYHLEEREKAIQRARERTAWVRHLRSSLEQTGVAS